MTDDSNSGSECAIKLIYSVEARVESAGPPSSLSVGDTMARIQGIIERAIAEEFGDEPLLVSADVRVRCSGNFPNPPRRQAPRSNSKKDIVLNRLRSRNGVINKALREAIVWKPNTVSAQLDYLSKTGYSINRSRDDGVLRHRLA